MVQSMLRSPLQEKRKGPVPEPRSATQNEEPLSLERD
jgi:hypothetical protein